MKHFNKVVGVQIQLEMPESWGDPTAIIDKEGGNSLHDLIWAGVDFHLRHKDSIWRAIDLAAIDDQTNGFDIGTLRYYIFNFENEEELNRSIEWLEARMHQSYDSLSDYKQRLAKKKRKAKR